MADQFSFKKGARLPSRLIKLTSDAAFDLSTASVTFVYRPIASTERRTIAAVLVAGTTDTIRVDFDATAVAVVGQFEWQIEAVFGELTMIFPEREFFTFSVTPTIETP